MGGIGKFIASIVLAIFDGFMSRIRRDNEKKQEGREEVIADAHKEADDRKAAADQLEVDFAAMSPAERERLRLERDIYRD